MLSKIKTFWPFFVFLVAILVSGCSLNVFGQGRGEAGLRLSRDGGVNWETANQTGGKSSLSQNNIFSLVADPFGANKIYIATAGQGVYRTTDGGTVWQSTPLTLLNIEVRSIALDPLNPKTIYAAGGVAGKGRMFKSINSGEEWEEIFLEAVGKQALTAVTVDPRAHNRIFVANGNGDVLLSSDFGNTWRLLTTIADHYPIPDARKVAFNKADKACERSDAYEEDFVRSIIVDPYAPNVVYLLLAKGGLQKSTDAGETFRDLSLALAPYPCAVFSKVMALDPADTKILYQGSDFGLLRSNDQGESWQNVATIIQTESLPIRALALNPRNSQEIFIGASGAFYKSLDGGRNWSVTEVTDSGNINFILVNHSNPQSIMLGLHNGTAKSGFSLFPKSDTAADY